MLELIERLKPRAGGGGRTPPPGKAPGRPSARSRRSRPERRRGARGGARPRPAHDPAPPAGAPPRGARSRSRRRSGNSTRPPSTISCAATRTPPSPCSPTSPPRPTPSCACRPAGSRRGCSSAPGGSAGRARRGYRRLAPSRAAGEGDLDLDLTFEVAGGRPRHADDLVARRWVAPKRAICLLVDHSGSMEGHAVGLAAMAAAAVVLNRSERASTSVIAFAKDALVLQAPGGDAPTRGAGRRPALAAGQGPHRPRAGAADRLRPARAPARGRATRDPALRLPLHRRIGPAARPRRAGSRRCPRHERRPGIRCGGPCARLTRARLLSICDELRPITSWTAYAAFVS